MISVNFLYSKSVIHHNLSCTLLEIQLDEKLQVSVCFPAYTQLYQAAFPDRQLKSEAEPVTRTQMNPPTTGRPFLVLDIKLISEDHIPND